MAAIETALARYEGRVAITALHGLRGVGKTTLAAAYAERYRGDYRATWWIRAQAETSMRADLVALGIRLGWVGADDKEEPAVVATPERRITMTGIGILPPKVAEPGFGFGIRHVEHLCQRQGPGGGGKQEMLGHDSLPIECDRLSIMIGRGLVNAILSDMIAFPFTFTWD